MSTMMLTTDWSLCKVLFHALNMSFPIFDGAPIYALLPHVSDEEVSAIYCLMIMEIHKQISPFRMALETPNDILAEFSVSLDESIEEIEDLILAIESERVGHY